VFLMTRRILPVLFVILVFAVCGCRAIGTPVVTSVPTVTSETTPPEFPAEVGNTTLLKNSDIIVSLSPAVTEIICELGGESRLVGIGEYCDFPESIKSLPRCGSAANPDFAAIKELTPDLLITQSPIAKKDVTDLSAAGIEVLILQSPKTIDEFYTEYDDIAKALYGNTLYKEKSDAATKPIKEAFSSINSKTGDYICYVTDTYITTENGTFAAQVLDKFGSNIGGGRIIPAFMAQKDDEGNIITPESELLREGTTIFLPEYLSSLSDSDEDGVGDFEGSGEVIVIPEDLYSQTERPSGRIVELLDFLNRA
jgi:iron complex transport system substrate-binding protein